MTGMPSYRQVGTKAAVAASCDSLRAAFDQLRQGAQGGILWLLGRWAFASDGTAWGRRRRHCRGIDGARVLDAVKLPVRWHRELVVSDYAGCGSRI